MRKLLVIGLAAGLSLLLLACQTPAAPVDTELSNVQATIEQAPVEAPTATTAPVESPVPTADTGQGDTTASGDTSTNGDNAASEPDPLSVDPARPGFTLDGSPTLGAADAPVVIIDFSDFQ